MQDTNERELMSLKIYRLSSVSTVTAVGQSTNTIFANGKIVGIRCTAGVVPNGAGRISAEVALNNNVNGNAEIGTGSASSDNLLTRMNVALGPAASPAFNLQDFVPMNISVSQGNILCINVLASGAAPTNAFFGFDVLIMEGR